MKEKVLAYDEKGHAVKVEPEETSLNSYLLELEDLDMHMRELYCVTDSLAIGKCEQGDNTIGDIFSHISRSIENLRAELDEICSGMTQSHALQRVVKKEQPAQL